VEQLGGVVENEQVEQQGGVVENFLNCFCSVVSNFEASPYHLCLLNSTYHVLSAHIQNYWGRWPFEH
jgi:hypothetical protein